MAKFKIPFQLENFNDVYPKPSEVRQVAKDGGENARITLSRLWLSEGIPAAFAKCPAVYESMRSWLSSILDVHAKEIGVAGSARLGASLAPKKLGKLFCDESDLDLFVVSNDLFKRIKDEFYEWSLAYEEGRINPRCETEGKYWKDNNIRGNDLIHNRGFIDHNMIPNFDRFPVTQKVSQTMYTLTVKLKTTPNAPNPKKASLRCYSCWDSFIRQMCLNLIS